MSENWHFHFINARGQLAGLSQSVAACLQEAEALCTQATRPLPLDIVVNAGPLPPAFEGASGMTPQKGIIYLTLDPSAGNLLPALKRTILHEYHHALRWESVGYGDTLFEAAITEGLAGHFVQELLGTPPEPWETALSTADIQPYLAAFNKNANNSAYDHPEWFFGAADLPNWLGYTLGYQIVAAFLSANPKLKPSTLTDHAAYHFEPCIL